MRRVAPLAAADAASLLVAKDTEPVLLAVSGGADSMALLGLAAAHRSPRLTSCATVDHGLRADSAREAALVAETAARLGIRHETLRWTDNKPSAGLPAAARAARYRLLVAQARDLGCDTIVTAHTQDDQAETLLMRLAHGSGVDGLAAMAQMAPLDGLALWRPLLGVSRACLRATALSLGLPFVDDPTNDDHGFERVRWRAEIARGLFDASRLAASARRAGEAAAALEAIAADLFTRHRVDDGLDYAALRPVAVALRRRAVARLVAQAGGAADRLDRLEALCARLDTAVDNGVIVASSLGGTVLRIDRTGRLTARPETGRRRNAPR